ncbi:MAG: 50S ribosomal protein L35ae [Desulfurococcales archaeon]|nr:50S ribosomal protein L35ae [Desulfurococcales archaeon]
MEVKGIIVGYARGGGRLYTGRVIVRLNADEKTTAKMVGGKVYYIDGKGNRYIGRILKIHGKRGSSVIVRFKKNIPGQAFGSTVKAVK